MPGSYMGSGGGNSYPHSCVVRALPTKPSLQPLIFNIFSHKNHVSWLSHKML